MDNLVGIRLFCVLVSRQTDQPCGANVTTTPTTTPTITLQSHVVNVANLATATNTILWFAPQTYTPGLCLLAENYAKTAGLPQLYLRFDQALTSNLTRTRGKKKLVEEYAPELVHSFTTRLLQQLVQHRPRLVIINNAVMLSYMLGKPATLQQYRGSVYFINGVPAVVVDTLRTTGGMNKLHAVPYAAFLFLQDLKRAAAWYKRQIFAEPRFEYTVVDTLSAFDEFENEARAASLIAIDIETAGRAAGAVMTCIGYACYNAQTLQCRTFVVPFVSPSHADGNHWTEDELVVVLQRIAKIHDLPTPKCLQNGAYDCSYLLRYRLPLRNWWLDTAVMFNALWTELPKRLDFIASLFVVHYRYWKDEKNDDEKDDVKIGVVPSNADVWARQLRYNALDCYYTALSCVQLLHVLGQQPWAVNNYAMRFRQTIGPALRMSMCGVRVNEQLRDAIIARLDKEASTALRDLRTMVDDPEFLPSSAPQVIALLYDTLRAEPIKHGRGKPQRDANEKTLQLVQTQHPLYARIIAQLWAAKKPRNNASKYGAWQYDETARRWKGLRLWNNRWYYKMNATGTETERYSSAESNFWLGTQVQNVPYGIREFIEPDDGYVLFDFDYSKADFWHTAFASEESNMMALVEKEARGEIDVHCYHASKFFSKPYDEIYAGYKAKEPWVVDSLHGVRQNSKRIVYGANYLMAGFTLFLTMGKDAVDATAKMMQQDPTRWTTQAYKRFCQSLLDFYFSDMYPELLPWLERTTLQVKLNSNLAIACGGNARKFSANLGKDKAAQRELAAFYGQGGTARMINRAMDQMFYGANPLWSSDLMVLFQVHDSIVGQVRKDKLHLLAQLKQTMEITNTINKRSFIVPVEGSVGLGWGARMCSWHTGVTLTDIENANNKWRQKNGFANS